MPKKIEVIEVRRYVYEPDLEGSSVYAEQDVDTIEGAIELDKKDVDEGATTIHDIAEGYFEVTTRTWRIIDEP